MPHQFTCETCGRAFTADPSPSRRYCSRACWRTRPQKADAPGYTCEACGRPFHRPASSFKRSKRIYCSAQCCGDGKRTTDTQGKLLGRPGVYAITHTPSGRTYIGSTTDFARRWRQHRGALAGGRHRRKALQATWTQDGAQAFEFTVLEDVLSTDDLIAREQAWLDAYRDRGCPLFNVAPLAGTSAGVRYSAEVRAGLNAGHRFRGKLTEASVRTIKGMLASGASYDEIASAYGIHRHTAYMIASGRMWPDVHAAASEG